jgi:nitrogen regulatory protein P-II 1
MKLVTAVIKPFMLDKLARALTKAPLTGFTVSEARGYGHGHEEMEILSARVKVEIVVRNENLKTVCDVIVKTVSTHQEGDGILYVSDVESVTNIRTGVENSDTLTAR